VKKDKRKSREDRQGVIFPEVKLSGATELTLRRFNPWWDGQAGPEIPRYRRHLVGQIHKRIEQKLAPIVVVRGARQIGKTTAQIQVLEDLLSQGVSPKQVFRVQFDDLEGIEALEDPILRLVDWYENVILKSTLNDSAHRGAPVLLFFDEVQNLPNWAPQLKSLVDSSTTQVVVTGSSALRIELGRDSLAGRITTIEAGVLSLTEVGSMRNINVGDPFLPDNGLEALVHLEFWQELRSHGLAKQSMRDQAFGFFSERGGYPIAHAKPTTPWSLIADQLNETVIKRVVQHDLRIGERGRKRDPDLLEALFRVVCRYAGQAPAIASIAQEIRDSMRANFGDQRARYYLKFLADSLLVRTIEPLEIRLKKRRGSPKLCLADHALRASWLHEIIPLVPSELARQSHLSTLSGHIAESIVGATLCTISGLDVNHKPEFKKGSKSEPEVDFVLTIGTKRIPIEVKYQARLDPIRDILGLQAFMNKPANSAPFGIVVTQIDTDHKFDNHIVALPLSTLLLLR
jgi:predicted AAA+ superfamily ATPase